MDDRIKQFIEDNIDLIESNQWEEVYEKADELNDDIGKFTEIMLKADIHPEIYLKELPCNFLINSDIKEFEIPDIVTSIGEGAFYNCSRLASITIPDSVEIIDYSAFCSCDSLTNVTIPNSVTKIDSYAFHYCFKLESVTIPDSVIYIGDQAFSNCMNLRSVAIGNGISRIEDSTFKGCTILKNVKIGSNITSIGYTAFCDCGDNLIIDYQGTKRDWEKIYNKNAFIYTSFTVNCIDGTIIKNED